MGQTTRKGTSIRSASTQAPLLHAETRHLQGYFDGETRTRTGDTTIFSRVLYQLSYLAARREDTAAALTTRRPADDDQPAAQLSNSGSGSIGTPPSTRQPTFQISKCRCGPLAVPVAPT